ncbi:facilitated trehalose transporter Tret1 isoform X1 [Neodiprion lecontei]|uniref:Facilitated trehalose transporter Tret1 isoform X1 n=1 Tax=Neodiprion lecontei TaxID=441921 RepID=A0A6J0BHH0_NEOLC|nr:facilitated trehalose transporter Tret1 isoform X1 [Neodiprion lecontei]XP_046593799.1 facilitated trehalose transporter Tret1 isoform X1 [Neodiprion lecontei]
MIAEAKYWWKIFHVNEYKSILAALAAHSGQISVGLSQGFSAVLIPKLLESGFATESEASWVASLGIVSNPIGALAAGVAAELFGRRAVVALATLPHAAGWLFIALATNVPLLYTGRFVSGLGAGMANGLYLYVSEVAAPEQRGWLASSGPAVVSLGVLMAYSLGALTTWQRAAAISIAPAIVSLALVRLLPETPAWLAAKGRTADARKSLLWLRGPGVSTEAEHSELCKSNVENQRRAGGGLLKALYKPNVWKPFLTLFFFFALQQLSGIYVILFYAVTVLQDIGVSIDEYAASVAIGGVRLFSAILGAGLARSVGRKKLACVSGLGMAVFAAGVALSMRYAMPSWVPLMCIGGHVGFSMIGYLTLPWVMTSELYLLRFRGPLSGLTTGLAQMMTFAAVKTYPDLRTAIGLEMTMWIFSTSGLIGAIFAMTILPETKGRSLNQIENEFAKNTQPEVTTVDVQSRIRNNSLPRFRSVSEDRSHGDPVGIQSSAHWRNVFAYDNLGLDVTLPKKIKEEHGKVQSILDSGEPSNRKISVEGGQVNAVSSYEHVYV